MLASRARAGRPSSADELGFDVRPRAPTKMLSCDATVVQQRSTGCSPSSVVGKRRQAIHVRRKIVMKWQTATELRSHRPRAGWKRASLAGFGGLLALRLMACASSDEN